MKTFAEKLAALPDPMSPEQLADAWGCSADTVRGMCDRAEIRCFRTGKLWKIEKSAVREHMARGRVADPVTFHTERKPI